MNGDRSKIRMSGFVQNSDSGFKALFVVGMVRSAILRSKQSKTGRRGTIRVMDKISALFDNDLDRATKEINRLKLNG